MGTCHHDDLLSAGGVPAGAVAPCPCQAEHGLTGPGPPRFSAGSVGRATIAVPARHTSRRCGSHREAAARRGRHQARRRRPARPRGRGLHGRGGHRRRRWPVAGDRGHLRPRAARHHAARAQRVPICADLRAAGDWTPILMLTAKDGDLDEAEALDTGATTTSPSRSRSRCWWRGPGAAAPVGRPCGGPGGRGRPAYRSARRRAWRGDGELALTAREFDVLALLVRRAGQVLSKAEILDAVGQRLRGRPQHHRGVRAAAAAQGRRTVRPPLDRDRARGRLPDGDR